MSGRCSERRQELGIGLMAPNLGTVARLGAVGLAARSNTKAVDKLGLNLLFFTNHVW